MGDVYKRTDWNSLIGDVNDVLQNPPEDTDCNPIDSIDEVDPDHIWTKSDVQSIQDALQQTCDGITFDNIPDLWKQSIIDEINAAIVQAWCDCEPTEECLEECSNCGDMDILEWNFTTHGCTEAATPCTAQNDAANLGDQADAAAYTYSVKWELYCTDLWHIDCLNKKIEHLTQQLTVLETHRDQACADGPPSACEAAQDAVDAKQSELDAANEALDQAEEDRDQHEEEATEQRDICNAKAAACWAIIHNLPGISLVNNIGAHPWVDFECEHFPSWAIADPRECRDGWLVAQIRQVTHYPWGDVQVLNYTTVGGGAYSPDGTPYTRTRLYHGYECLSRSPYSCFGGCEWADRCDTDHPYCCDTTYYMRTYLTKPACDRECKDAVPCPP